MDKNFLKDIVEARERSRKKKKFVIAILLIASLGGAAAIASAIGVNNSAKNDSQKVIESDEYKYGYMAAKCRQGVDAYKNMEQQINDESTQLAAQTQKDVASLTAQAASYKQDQDAAYRRAVIDITSTYDQGFISHEEWSKRIDALGAVPQNIAKANEIAASGSSKLLEDSLRKLEVNKASLAQISNNVSRLEACVDTANNSQDFNSTQVAELETIAANSTVRP